MMSINDVKTVMRDVELKGSAAATTFMETEIRPQMEAMTKSKASRFGLKALLAVAMMSSLATVAFANNQQLSNLEGKINSAKDGLMNFLKNIILAVGVVSLACCGVVLIFGIGGQRSSEQAKAWAFRIFFGMAIVLCADLIIGWVNDLFGVAGAGGGAAGG